jgi:hypothetical protein
MIGVHEAIDATEYDDIALNPQMMMRQKSIRALYASVGDRDPGSGQDYRHVVYRYYPPWIR